MGTEILCHKQSISIFSPLYPQRYPSLIFVVPVILDDEHDVQHLNVDSLIYIAQRMSHRIASADLPFELQSHLTPTLDDETGWPETFDLDLLDLVRKILPEEFRKDSL
jgi:hypothetical protein